MLRLSFFGEKAAGGLPTTESLGWIPRGESESGGTGRRTRWSIASPCSQRPRMPPWWRAPQKCCPRARSLALSRCPLSSSLAPRLTSQPQLLQARAKMEMERAEHARIARSAHLLAARHAREAEEARIAQGRAERSVRLERQARCTEESAAQQFKDEATRRARQASVAKRAQEVPAARGKAPAPATPKPANAKRRTSDPPEDEGRKPATLKRRR